MESSSCCERTKKEAGKRLSCVNNSTFVSQLIGELDERFDFECDPNCPEKIIDKLLATQCKESLQEWIYSIREALENTPREPDSWEGQWKAASALFYMTVRQLITHPEGNHDESEFIRRIVQLPHDDPQLSQTLGAIIAATLLGGVLDFSGSGDERKPEHVHLISNVSPMADDFETPIKLALFCAWFPAHGSTPGYLDGSIPWRDQDEKCLITRIKKARHQKHKTVAFIFDGNGLNIQALNCVAKTFKVSFLWQASQENQALTEVFGMEPGELLEDIRLFWEIDTESTIKQGAPVMPIPPNVSINVTTKGDSSSVSVATGENSSINQTTHQHIQTGIGFEALAPLLAALKQEIANANSPKLTSNFNEVEKQVNSGKPDKTLITRGLEAVQQGAAYVANGEKIVTAVNKIIESVSSIAS